MNPALRTLVGAALAVLPTAACSSDWKAAFDEKAADGHFDSVAIADPDEALTFARVRRDGEPRLLGVTGYRGGVVSAVDLGATAGAAMQDPVTAFAGLGYDGLLALVRRADAVRVEVPADELEIPVDLHDHHVAVGTNFPEHADDAGVKDGPFLFAKLVQPTSARAEVPAGAALLDYEVEAAWVTLAPVAEGERPAALGVIVADEFTDRETLLHHLSPLDVASGDGFTTGKSFPGFLPVGDLFVIPRDPRAFVAGLELTLWVNGELRQRSRADAMVWDLDAILANTFAWKDRRWDHRGQQVSLLGEGRSGIRERTLLLSGTPHGTVFDGLRARHFVGGFGRWLAGGWSRGAFHCVADAYAADARTARAYLAPGDRVDIRVDKLGTIRSVVVP